MPGEPCSLKLLVMRLHIFPWVITSCYAVCEQKETRLQSRMLQLLQYWLHLKGDVSTYLSAGRHCVGRHHPAALAQAISHVKLIVSA